MSEAPGSHRDLIDLLAKPGLVVLTGLAGAGRTTTLRRIAAAGKGPIFHGGGLSILRHVPGLAVIRAVRAKLPVDDVALFAEAVRSRVRDGLLVLDDLQWTDRVTLAALPDISRYCRVIVALRTPHALSEEALAPIRQSAARWAEVPPLSIDEANALVRATARDLTDARVAEVVSRGGGIPLLLESLARIASKGTITSQGAVADDDRGVAHAVASSLAELPRSARTAIAALGLLGRPASATLLGPGLAALAESGLVTEVDDQFGARSPYVAEVAAGLLADTERQAVHRRLADFVPDYEAARHLAAAGEPVAAAARALAAADAAITSGERADALLLAMDVAPSPDLARRAASAALVVGRPATALRVLETPGVPDGLAEFAEIRAEALLQQGKLVAAAEAIADLPGPSALHDRVRLLSALTDPEVRTEVIARHGSRPQDPALQAALAASAASVREPGWEEALADAAATAGDAGDLLSARCSAWLLVESLADDGRLTEAADTAQRAATACGEDLAYSWQTRFLAAELWCGALAGGDLDRVARQAIDLIDRTLPRGARDYAIAAASLAEADSGLLGPARARLAPITDPTPWLTWVATESAWLDGQSIADSPPTSDRLAGGLARITAQWSRHDAQWSRNDGEPESLDTDPPTPLVPVQIALEAWQTPSPHAFSSAAAAWHGLARREEVRCLLAAGLHATDAETAVPLLLEAEKLADEAGLVVLLGRTRRALRRHSVRRETRGPRAGEELTDRELEVLRLVAQGEPTRRIAGLLGISRDTVETHIRAGMRKLGARTRTEAAARMREAAG